MYSKIPIHEVQLTLIDCLEQTSSILDFSLAQTTYNSTFQVLMNEILLKDYIKNDYFLKFEKQIIEEENDDVSGSINKIWFVVCKVFIYKEIV